ncbi:MAG TPA: ABC transporter ATP-binding protein [Anaeromyxobacteraceae bacterium]|nr:ABC transporter ATP-binding protein [Anaeromyxobacteraceae bacterium]
MPFDVRGLSYETNGRAVLRDVSFHVQAGERVVVLGVNGCGKTTLLKLLDALVFPSAGEVRWRDRRIDARALDDATFRRAFRSEVGLLFQNVDAMLFNPTVADEIAFGPRQLDLPEPEARAERWARTFMVDSMLERAPFELSGGEKKRVALAAIFAVGPRVVLLDEATANLDPASSAALVDFLAARRDLTVITATHNLTIAQELGERALLLAPGRSGLLFDGPTEQLLSSEALLVESGLAHRHRHRHAGSEHAHFHVHDTE